jgi:16S rRNA (guanine966-N2)-methyltransferase
MTRPTSDRVREAIFSMLDSLDVLEGASVADLFAGSGALGIEALSRGAARATFVDCDRRAVEVIRSNLASVGLGPAEVVAADALRWAATAPRFDVVLADPPYAYAEWSGLLESLVNVAGLLVLETATHATLDPRWRLLKQKQYGGTVVNIVEPAPRPTDDPGARLKGGM